MVFDSFCSILWRLEDPDFVVRDTRVAREFNALPHLHEANAVERDAFNLKLSSVQIKKWQHQINPPSPTLVPTTQRAQSLDCCYPPSRRVALHLHLAPSSPPQNMLINGTSNGSFHGASPAPRQISH